MVRINEILRNVKPPEKINEPRYTPNGLRIACTEGSNDAPTIEDLIMHRKKSGMKKLNINEFIKVKLTERGKDIFYHQYDGLNSRLGENGFTEFQLHEFMNLYGRYMINGLPSVIEDNHIYIYEKDLREV